MGKTNKCPNAHNGTEASVESANLAHHDRIWLAEIIRRIEASSRLDDSETLRQIIPSIETTQARILKRAESLAEHRGIVETTASWHAHGRTAIAIFSVIVFLGGFLVAASALGDGSRAVNIVFALVALLGIHFLTLILWGLSVVHAQRSMPGSPGTLWIRLTALLTRSRYRPVMLQALVGMLGRARLLPWLIGGISHTLWCLAFLGILGGLLFMLAFREYHFTWNTTILPTEFFIALTQTLGRIPQVFGFLTPDAETVRNPANSASAQSVWASWLIGCVIIYGLLPRAVLAVLCLIRSHHGLSRLDIDHSLNYYIELKNRIQAAEGKGTIVDPDNGEQSLFITNQSSQTGSGHGTFLVGIEIPEDISWPPAQSGSAVKAQKIASGNERHRLLRTLSEAPVKQLLIACDAHSSPDRGTLRLIAEIKGYAEHCKAWLMLRSERTADPDRIEHWHEELGKIGLRGEDVIEDERLALQWLEQGNE